MLTDGEILDTYRSAVDATMHVANARDGFASNMSRESRLAGLRAIEREAAARALTDAVAYLEKPRHISSYNAEPPIQRMSNWQVSDWLRARAAEIREGKIDE